MPRWRLAVHALDRTGPPMLALSFARWLTSHRSSDELDVIAFRGGDLVDAFVDLAPVHVILDPSEAWDPRTPDPSRSRTLSERAARMPTADATLLVSVAASQVLPFVPRNSGRIVTWVVEQGDDLHWLEEPVAVVERTSSWLAGSQGTRRALLGRLPHGTDVHVCAEFVDRPPTFPPDLIDHCRAALGVDADEVLVMGAGIGTSRKGVDLFMEVALAAQRRGLDRVSFVWLGGERDDLFWRTRSEAMRLGVDRLRWFGTVPDVNRWLAAADVFAQTARLDAFPLVCLHAAAAGTPVVAFAGAGGVEEMFDNTFIGCPYPDVERFVDHIERMIDPAERRRSGAAQHAAISDRFLTEAAAPRVFGHLEHAVERAAGDPAA